MKVLLWTLWLIPFLSAGVNDPISFPDAAFKAALVARYDTNTDGEISEGEAAAVSSLYATHAGITDITGVSYFTNLTVLEVGYNNLTALPDLSALTQLQFLIVNHNQLTQLPDLSALTQLRRLYAHVNRLTTTPDLTGNPQLERLLLLVNQINTLPDLSHLSNLQWLNLEHNRLADVPDVSGLSSLAHLTLHNNELDEEDCAQINSVLGLGLTEFSFSPNRFGQTISCDCTLVPTSLPTDQTPCLGLPMTLAVEMEPRSNSVFTYQWYRDGVAMSEATAASSHLTIPYMTPEYYGDYVCRVTGCDDLTYDTPSVSVTAYLDQSEAPCESMLVVWPASGIQPVEGHGAAALFATLSAPPDGQKFVNGSSPDFDLYRYQQRGWTFDTDNWFKTKLMHIRLLEDGAVGLDARTRSKRGELQYNFLYAGPNGTQTVQRPVHPVTNNDGPLRALWFDGNLRNTPGAEVTLPLRLKWDDPDVITSFQAEFGFSDAVLTFDSVTTADTLTDGWLVDAALDPSPVDGHRVVLTGVGPSPLGGDGVLVLVHFTVNNVSVDRWSPLNAELVSFNGNAETATSPPGRFTVWSCEPGDVDGGGLAQLTDAALALHQVVGREHAYISLSSSLCADADCDGNLTAYDASLIFQKVLGDLDEFCVSTAEAAPVDPVILNAPVLEVSAGEPFQIPLQISAVDPAAALKGFQFTLNYDPTRLTLTQADTFGGLADGMTTLDNASRAGQIKVAGFHGEGLWGEGLLLSLRGVAGPEPGLVTLTFEDAGLNAGNPVLLTEPITLEIGAPLGPAHTDAFLWSVEATPSAIIRPRVDGVVATVRYQFEVLSQPQWGTVTLAAQGFRYTPEPGFQGRDLFLYRAFDPEGRSVDGIAQVMILPADYAVYLNLWPQGDVLGLVERLNQAAAR